MRSSKEPLAFPEDFLHTYTVFHLNPTAMLQATIDRANFFEHLHELDIAAQVKLIKKLMLKLLHHQKRRLGIDNDLSRLHSTYLFQLSHLSSETKMATTGKIIKAKAILKEWAQKTDAALAYPREVLLANGDLLHVKFDFFLQCLMVNRTINGNLRYYMNILSRANFLAYESSRSKKSIAQIENLINGVLAADGVRLPQTTLHLETFTEHHARIYEAVCELCISKAAEKRFPLIRILMRQWYDRMLWTNRVVAKAQIFD